MKTLILQWSKSQVDIKLFIYLNGKTIFKNKRIQDFDIIYISMNLTEDGIKIAKYIRDLNYNNTIVLISEYENRVLDGYTVNAYRYYLKPLKYSNIEESMHHVLKKQIGDFYQYKYQGLIRRIPYDKIVCFESMQHYIDIYVCEGIDAIHIKESLKNIQEHCPQYFIRCQRSYIVNTHYILERRGNRLLLSNNKLVDISPLHVKKVIELMNKRGNRNE